MWGDFSVALGGAHESITFFERAGKVNLEGVLLTRSVKVPVGAAARPPENYVWQGRSLGKVTANAASAGGAPLPKMGCWVADSTVFP